MESLILKRISLDKIVIPVSMKIPCYTSIVGTYLPTYLPTSYIPIPILVRLGTYLFANYI
jgi:hypothetical protein